MIERLSCNYLEDVLTFGENLHSNFASLYNYSSLNENENITYIYLKENKVIGFIHIQDVYDEVSIIDIFVDESCRNQKVGTKLVNHVFNQFSNKRFLLEVSENNSLAINFYKELGFKKIAVRKGYYSGVDGFVMERK